MAIRGPSLSACGLACNFTSHLSEKIALGNPKRISGLQTCKQAERPRYDACPPRLVAGPKPRAIVAVEAQHPGLDNVEILGVLPTLVAHVNSPPSPVPAPLHGGACWLNARGSCRSRKRVNRSVSSVLATGPRSHARFSSASAHWFRYR